MLVAVRHGETEMNDNGGKGGERTRGWLPVPLTVKGMKAMIDTAESLTGVEDIKALYCSDLVRSVQSAEEIAHVLAMPIDPREDLRDWNIGEYAGQEIKKILKDLHSFMDDPMKKVPGGEPYQSFLNRAIPFITELVESDDLCIAITHNRVMTLIAALCKNKGKHPDTETLKSKGPVDPAGVLIVRNDWTISYSSQRMD